MRFRHPEPRFCRPRRLPPVSQLVGTVSALWRYPVKSMLGEAVSGPVAVGGDGIAGDRRFGVVDASTGIVASAKRPRRWRRLLLLQARLLGEDVIRIDFPDGSSVVSTGDTLDEALSEFVGEKVELRSQAPLGAELERALPDDVFTAGPDADVPFATLPMALASPPGTFFDFSPLHLITSASLARAEELHPVGRVDAVRYRPNMVIDTVAGLAGFVENDWAGRRLHLGPHVVIEALIPSPRCVIPTLAHGALPSDFDALRVLQRHNVVTVPIAEIGPAPCLGIHAMVVAGGVVAPGDEVRLAS